MWSDTLLAAERLHLLRLLVWGGASVLAGTGLLGFMAGRRLRSALLAHFAVQMLAWGGVIAAVAALGLQRAVERDFAGATRLDRLTWFYTGLDLGYVAVGLTLVLAGRLLERRMALMGAGVGIVVQGTALLALHGRFLAALARLV